MFWVFLSFFFKVSATRRKDNGCCAHFSESTLVPKWWKPSDVAQPGCSISGSSYGNTGNPTGLQAVITWNEYFNYVMILITAYLSLYSWIQSSFSTHHEIEMYLPRFLFYFGEWVGFHRGGDCIDNHVDTARVPSAGTAAYGPGPWSYLPQP